MRRHTLIIGLGLALLGGVALARGPHGPRHGPDFEQRIEHLADQLEVTAAQRAALREIVDAHRPQQRQLRDRMRANAEAVRALDPAAADYQARVSVLAAEHGDIAAQRLRLRTELRAAVHGVLTDAQRTRLNALREQRPHHRGG